MFCKYSLLLLAATVCLLSQISPCASRRYSREAVEDDLLLDNLVEEDLKDEGVEDLVSTTELPSAVETTSSSKEEGCNSPAARRNTDRYIDKILDEVRPKLPEPAFLPERVGRFRLFNGTLNNLVSMRRVGPALVRCTDDAFSFLVPVGLRNLTGKYFWETDAGVPVFRGFMDMMIGRVDADVLYTRIRNSEDGQPRARVDKLTITKLQGVRVNFDGLGPLNTIASRFTDLAVRFFSRGVSRALEGPVRSILNKELQNVEKYEMFYW